MEKLAVFFTIRIDSKLSNNYSTSVLYQSLTSFFFFINSIDYTILLDCN